MFKKGNYMPLKVAGKFRKNIFGFCRKYENKYVIIVIARFLTDVIKEQVFNGSINYWDDTSIFIPGKIKHLQNYFTCEELNVDAKIPVQKIFASLPVSLLFN